jgi:hypothetical protein
MIKNVNEFIFFLGVGGICFLAAKKNKSLNFYVATFTVLFMITWRLPFGNISSRYYSSLIFPFCFFASCFLEKISIITNKRIISTGILVIVFVFWAYKNYYLTQVNTNLFVIGDYLDQTHRTTDNCQLKMYYSDAIRIFPNIKKDDSVKMYFDDKDIKDVSSFAEGFQTVNSTILYDIIIKKNTSLRIKAKNKNIIFKQVLSLFYQRNMKNKHCMYYIKSIIPCNVVSLNSEIFPESGVLKNGDLELLDTPEHSFKKMKDHIGNYELFFENDSSVRTPVNAYFHNATEQTRFHPYYNCTDSNAISGKYSALIKNNRKDALSYLIFNQAFKSGEYEYSILTKGEKETQICLFIDLYHDGKWDVKPLAFFVIPDKRLYQISVPISVQHLKNNEYFLVGVYVQNGQAYFDNLKVSFQ